MAPLILSFITAGLFLALSLYTYGANAMAENPWVALVFWGMLGAGVAVFAISRPMPAWLCQARERLAALFGAEPNLAGCGC